MTPMLKAPGTTRLKLSLIDCFQYFRFQVQLAPLQCGSGARAGQCSSVPESLTWQAPVSKRLKLKCDKPLPNCAFSFNLRRYTKGTTPAPARGMKGRTGFGQT